MRCSHRQRRNHAFFHFSSDSVPEWAKKNTQLICWKAFFWQNKFFDPKKIEQTNKNRLIKNHRSHRTIRIDTINFIWVVHLVLSSLSLFIMIISQEFRADCLLCHHPVRFAPEFLLGAMIEHAYTLPITDHMVWLSRFTFGYVCCNFFPFDNVLDIFLSLSKHMYSYFACTFLYSIKRLYLYCFGKTFQTYRITDLHQIQMNAGAWTTRKKSNVIFIDERHFSRAFFSFNIFSMYFHNPKCVFGFFALGQSSNRTRRHFIDITWFSAYERFT